MRVAIVHTIRTPKGAHSTAKLVIANVPEKTSHEAIVDVLEKKGRAGEFSEGGIPWGNHAIKNEAKTGGFGKGLENIDSAPAVEWEELIDSKPEIKRVTLRLEKPEYDAAVAAAQRAGLNIQKWFVKVTNEASGYAG